LVAHHLLWARCARTREAMHLVRSARLRLDEGRTHSDLGGRQHTVFNINFVLNGVVVGDLGAELGDPGGEGCLDAPELVCVSQATIEQRGVSLVPSSAC